MLAKATHDRPTLREVRATIQAIAGRSSGPIAVPAPPADEDVLTVDEGTRDDIALTLPGKLGVLSTVKDIDMAAIKAKDPAPTARWVWILVVVLLAAGGVLIAVAAH
jgi:hypothetical protein